jgi:phage gpG-like protein
MADNLAGMIRDDYGWFLGKFAQVKPDLRAAEAAKAMIVRRTRRRHVDRHGRPFAPYAASTLAKKARKGQSSRVTLTDSGLMLDRLTVKEAKGHARYTVRNGETRRQSEVRFGTARDERIANYHISDRPRRKIPMRDFMGLTDREERVMSSQMQSDVATFKPRDRRGKYSVKVFG